MLKLLLFPLVLGVAVIVSYFAMLKASEDSKKYSLGNISETAKITAYDIRYWTGRDAGSGYTLGELDGTFSSMIRLSPQAINVALFRPYIWEVNNPLMLLSAIESLTILLICVYISIRRNVTIVSAFSTPDVVFMLVFSLTFAFAVGVSTYNFGTLVRYKIPMIPYFLISLGLIASYSNKEAKFAALESTE
jgi:hypothetical protein